MSIPGFSPFPPIPSRSAPEAEFDLNMYNLFQHFAVTHRNELLAFIDFLENNSTVIGAALNATTIGLTTPAAGKFTDLTATTRLEIPAPDGDGHGRITYASSAGSLKLDASGGAGSGAFVDFGAADNTTESVTYRFGRGTNTSGDASLQMFAHDGGATIKAQIDKGGNGYFTGYLGVGALAAAYRLSVSETSDSSAVRIYANNASYSQRLIMGSCDRAATSAYDFFRFYSGGLTDLEAQLTGTGNLQLDGAVTGGGADYAEYFEWQDGNPAGEDRRGVAVVLEGDQIRPAVAGEHPIGVISATPSVIGDGDMDRWKGKYLRDAFGAYLWEDYEVAEWTEVVTETIPAPEEGGDLQTVTRDVPHSHAVDAVPEGVQVPPEATRSTQQRRVLNLAYDPDLPYLPRSERPEWALVGLLGKLRIRSGQPTAPGWIKMRDVSAEVAEWLVK